MTAAWGHELDDDLSGYDWGDGDEDDLDGDTAWDGPTHECGCPMREACDQVPRRPSLWERLRRALS